MEKRVIIKFSIIPAVLLAAIFSLFYWRAISVEKSRQIIIEKENEIQQAQITLASAGQLKMRDRQINDRLSEVREDLYTMDQAVELVKRISAIAARHQVLLNDFKFDLEKYISQKDLAGEYGPFVVPFECVVQSDYSRIGKFINTIEKRKFISYIVNVKFYRDSSGKTNAVCEIKGALRFYNDSFLRSVKDENT